VSAAPGNSRLTVLYIEDNASNLQLVKRILRDRDDIVLCTASRGQEGIDIARDVLPGLVLLDLHLPDMPGADVLDALHDDPRTAAIPVVAVSADATVDQIRHLRAGGVADYVTKPFEVPRLLAVIDLFVASQPAAPSGSDASNGDGDGGRPGSGSTPAADDELILDARRVAELIGLDDDGSAFRSLAALALNEAADQIATIAQAPVAGHDAAAVSAAAHGLKSSAGAMGARRLASLADAVEQAARAGTLPTPSMLSELRRTLTETERAAIDAGGER
jgi:CheY-like chemotaxis protein